MLNQIKQRLQSRRHAGQLLAEKLALLRHVRENALIMAIPQGGIPVGFEISAHLQAPFDISFSRRIRHPAHSEQSIGAVSMDEVVLHDNSHFIPQNYVLNQISMLQRALQAEFHRYYGSESRKDARGKTVVLVDDVLRDVDELVASLHTIERQDPAHIVVAAPIASIRAIHYLEDHDYELHYLFTEVPHQNRPYTYFPEISEEETRIIFRSRTESASIG